MVHIHYQQSARLVDFFYLILFLISVESFRPTSQLPNWRLILDSQDLFIPIWLMSWLSMGHWELSIITILGIFLLMSSLSIWFARKSIYLRVGAFFGLLLYIGLISSFGKIDHYLHLFLVACFFFIFLPSKVYNTEDKIEFLKIFRGIQVFVLMTYFVSGIFKVYGVVDQELHGLVSAFSSESLSLNISKTRFLTGIEPFLSEYILFHKSWIYPIVLILGFLIEVSAVVVVFNQKLQRLWGLSAIFLHLGILLTVGPDFFYQMALIGILFLFPPAS